MTSFEREIKELKIAVANLQAKVEELGKKPKKSETAEKKSKD